MVYPGYVYDKQHQSKDIATCLLGSRPFLPHVGKVFVTPNKNWEYDLV